MAKHPGLDFADIRAQVMLRHPYQVREGMLIVNVGRLSWSDIDYLDQSDCNHMHAMCPECLGDWLEEYCVRMWDAANPSAVYHWDDIVIALLEDQGVRAELDPTFIFE